MEFKFAFRVMVLLWVAFVAACSTTPAVKEKNTKQAVVAKSFLKNIGAGTLAMNSFKKAMEQQSADQPNVAAMVQRAFNDVGEDVFLDLAADVYSRHVAYADLVELENFSKDQTIQKYFNIVFGQFESSEKMSEKEFLNEFDENELTKLMKFVYSDSFTRLQASLPAINQDLTDESRMLGERVMRDYIKSQ